MRQDSGPGHVLFTWLGYSCCRPYDTAGQVCPACRDKRVTADMTDDTAADSVAARDGAVDDARRHLSPVVDHLDDKFPNTDRDHVADVVESVFSELSSDAKIPDHLAALTQHHAQDLLRTEGAGPTRSAVPDAAPGDDPQTPDDPAPTVAGR